MSWRFGIGIRGLIGIVGWVGRVRYLVSDFQAGWRDGVCWMDV
jgi:hypothetical protein